MFDIGRVKYRENSIRKKRTELTDIMGTLKGMRKRMQTRDRNGSDSKHAENISGQSRITLHVFSISKQKVDKRNFIL